MKKFNSILANANAEIEYKSVTAKILRKYSPLPGEELDQSSIENLIKNHAFIGSHKVSHDEIADELHTLSGLLNREQLAKNFLSSISTNNPSWRGGLPAFAIARKMPKHTFSESQVNSCKICCEPNSNIIDATFLNSIRIEVGSLANTNIYHLWFHLSMAYKSTPKTPTDSDIQIFRSIIDIFKKAEHDCKPANLVKSIRSLLPYKISVEQAMTFLEMFGTLSILETENHKGFMRQYTNLGIAPQKSHNSDWSYPLGWWKGSDGVNQEAIDYWFGDLICDK